MRTGWTQGEHERSGVRLNYWRTGDGGKPQLVLVHGFSDSGLCWAPVARELEAEYDLVMPDMVGHGLSSRARPGQEPDMAEDLAALIRDLGLSGPVLVGHSMGAAVSARLAALHPELVSALVLEDPPWLLLDPSGQAQRGQGEPPIVTWAKTLEHRTLEELLAEYRREHPSWPDDFVRIMCEAKKNLDPLIIDTLGLYLGSSGRDWPHLLGSIPQPLLLVTGDPSLGAIVDSRTADRVRELKPTTEIVNVSGVGHLIRFDDPTAYMRAIRDFLGRVAG